MHTDFSIRIADIMVLGINMEKIIFFLLLVLLNRFANV